MRYRWDDKKDEIIRENPKKCGFGFDVVIEVFEHPHIEAMKSDDPEQFFAIGFAQGNLITVVFECRQDELGEFIWLITYWKSSKFERRYYEKEINK